MFSTVQTFGTAAATISQMTWSGGRMADNPHMQRSAEKLTRILAWLEDRIDDEGDGLIPGTVSIHDIFLTAHVRFVQARPIGVTLPLEATPKVNALLERMDQRPSVRANPIWWWEPGVTGYDPDGTPVFG